ncbi:MAG: gliding motility-associated C-terminal domain-containing protein [Spirosomataceae bacterium]
MKHFLRTAFLVLFIINGIAAQNPAAVRFVRNQGQWDASVRYRADIPGGYLLLKEKSLMYVFWDTDALSSRHAAAGKASAARLSEGINGHAVEVAFEGANSAVQVKEEHPNAAKFNYFIGNDPSHWAANVPAFGEIVYHEVYPGIDFKMYAFRETLKYEFLVAPHADASKIKLRYQGSKELKLADNQLSVQTSVNSFRELKPYTYQDADNRTREIATQYRLEGEYLSFDFPKGYDRTLPLTIDPELVFSTFSGSFANNFGHAATYDEQGNMYSVGTLHSLGTFPTTAGAFQRQSGGGVDIALLKFSPDGTKLLYGTYIGGSDVDVPHSMIVNSKDELVLMGTTSSQNFPVTSGAYQTRFGGGTAVAPIGGFEFFNGSDLFILKLNATGTVLTASTLVGGNGNDGICRTFDFNLVNYGDEFRGEVVVDNNDNVYVASSTTSTNFPLVNPISTAYGGRQDAVVFKLSPDLKSLMASTYLGGTAPDAAYGLKWAPSGALYVTGVTRSSNLPAKTGAFKNVLSGSEDGFLAKFANDKLEQLTYLGTDSSDVAYLVDVDSEENVHVFGLTRGRYAVTAGTYVNANAGQFIHALDKSLSKTVFSTTIGSSRARPDMTPTAFLVNECGNIYLSGWGGIVNSRNGYNPTSNTVGLPVTPDAFRQTTTGSNFYIAILEKGAKSLLYGTFIGSTVSSSDGDHVDGGTSRFSKNGVIYQATCVCRQANFPSTPNVWSVNRNNQDCNNAAFKFDIDRLKADFDPYQGLTKGVVSGCAPLTLDFVNTSEGGKTYTWDVQGNNISRDPLKATYTFTQPGEYRVTLRAFNPLVCRGQDVVTKIIKVGVSKAKASGDTTVCSNVGVPLRAEGGLKYAWTPTAGLSNPNIANPVAKVSATTNFICTITDSACTVTRNVTVTVNNNKPDFNALKDTTICSGQSAVLTALGSATRYRWTPSLTLSDSVGTRVVARPVQTTVYTVTGVYADGCLPQKIITVKIDNSKPDFQVTPDTTICAGQSAQLLAQGAETFRWAVAPTLSDTTIKNPVAKPTQTTTYTVTATYPDGCKPRKTVTVTVERGPQNVNFDVAPVYACGEPTTLQYVNRTSGATRYEWDLGNGTQSLAATPAALKYAQNGTYQVTLRAYSPRGCESSVTQSVAVLNLDKIPNVITPNGDRKNDTFVIGIPNAQVEIYNRWGKRVFVSNNYGDDWGKDVLNGTYFYQLTLSGNVQCKGWVQVLQ